MSALCFIGGEFPPQLRLHLKNREDSGVAQSASTC